MLISNYESIEDNTLGPENRYTTRNISLEIHTYR
jgi:hypothetical protein